MKTKKCPDITGVAMSAEEEASAPAAGPAPESAPAARAPTAGAEAEAAAAAEAVPHLRRLSLPGDFPSGAVRHYHASSLPLSAVIDGFETSE
ncbi:Protein of unknown function [Gryllus bimaculatus]|nr:Protein of unknown function [Gryllus bimaculatus]